MNNERDVPINPGLDAKQLGSARRFAGLEMQATKYVITLVAATLFALHVLVPGLGIDAVAMSLLLLAVLPWLIPYLQNYLESGKFLGAEFKFLQQKVEVQEEKIRNQQEVIRLIYEALRRSLTQHEYRHLVDLQPDKPSSEYQHSYFLEMEMVRLCQHGYVEEMYQNSTWKMKEKGGSRFDLKEFYRITDTGMEYLKLLQELQNVVPPGGVRG